MDLAEIVQPPKPTDAGLNVFDALNRGSYTGSRCVRLVNARDGYGIAQEHACRSVPRNSLRSTSYLFAQTAKWRRWFFSFPPGISWFSMRRLATLNRTA